MDKSKQIEALKAELNALIMTPAEKKIEYAAGAAFERIVGGKVLNVGCEQLGRICQTEDGSLFIQANGRVGEEPSEWQSIWFHIELLESQIQLLQSEVSNLRQFMRDMCCDPVDFEEVEEL